MVALNNEISKSRQYGRNDWGDAFRNFAHPLNNDNLLYAYEKEDDSIIKS